MLIPFQTLFQKYNINPTGILHLGANSGQEAQTYEDLKVPQVIWVEALPGVYKELLKHLEPYPNQIAFKACVSDRDGEVVSFNIASNGGQSSSLLPLGTHAKEHPQVKYIGKIGLTTTRVDSLLKRYNIPIEKGWLLNADLQGAELMAMRGMGDYLDKFDYAYLEVNTDHLYQGCPLLPEIDDFMGKKGFQRREILMTNHKWGDALFTR